MITTRSAHDVVENKKDIAGEGSAERDGTRKQRPKDQHTYRLTWSRASIFQEAPAWLQTVDGRAATACTITPSALFPRQRCMNANREAQSSWKLSARLSEMMSKVMSALPQSWRERLGASLGIAKMPYSICLRDAELLNRCPA